MNDKPLEIRSEFLRVAELLFRKYRRPMTPRQLVDLGISDRILSDKLAGKTLSQTMKSKLSVHVRKYNQASMFIRTKPGYFYLRELLNSDQEIYNAPPLRKPVSKEQVLVFSSEVLDGLGRFQGIETNYEFYSNEILRRDNVRYLDRLDAESTEDYKQILTYVLVTRKGRLLSYRRGTFNRVEDFLKGSQCIGFGGHVSQLDRSLFSIEDVGLTENVIRELTEEIKIPLRDRQRLEQRQGLAMIGVLNDDSSSVGRRHFAFLFNYEASDDSGWEKPERGEKSITQLRWLERDGKAPLLRDFEYWSQLCLREFFPDQVRTQPSFVVRRKQPLRPPHLLCVVGSVGSGKSEATRILIEEFGYSEINSGRVLADLLGIPPVPATPREVFQRKAWSFINRPDGPRLLAQAIWSQLAVRRGARVLVDGLRQRATLDQLKGLASNVRLGVLFVHTPPDICYEFYNKRGGVPISIHEFLSVREAPVEAEVEEMISLADAVLYNWTGRSQYQDAVRDLLGEVGVGETATV